MKKIKAIILSCILFASIGCTFIEYFKEENSYPLFEAKTNNVTGSQIIISPEGRRFQKISGRFNWCVARYDDKDAKDKRFPHRIGRVYGGQVYETQEEYCLFVFVPDSGLGGWFIDETLVLPKPKAEEFGKVVLSTDDGEEAILEDEACIQAFLDRLLTRKHDVKRDEVQTEEFWGRITFYSREYPKLEFFLSIYGEQNNFYIMDWSNWDWIECTDIIEQYLSEYFE